MIFPFKRKIKEEPVNTGTRGENLAVKFLKKNKYKVLARNVRPDGHEELDIVCETRDDRVYVEVKTRTGDPNGEWRYGTPATAVTHEKRRHLLSAARAFHAQHPTKKALRMDVIEVYLPDGHDPEIHHIIDAFRS